MRRRGGVEDASHRPTRRSVADLLKDPGPLSSDEQDEVIEYLELQNKSSSLVFILALSVLHVILGFLFVWLALKGENVALPDFEGAAKRRNPLQAAEAASPSSSAVLQGVQGVCLVVGGVSLAFHSAPQDGAQFAGNSSESSVTTKEYRLHRRRVARRGRRVQLALGLVALLTSIWYTATLLQVRLPSGIDTPTALESVLQWVLVWWQPIFHAVIGASHEMLSSTEDELEGLRQHTYHHEKI